MTEYHGSQVQHSCSPCGSQKAERLQVQVHSTLPGNSPNALLPPARPRLQKLPVHHQLETRQACVQQESVRGSLQVTTNGVSGLGLKIKKEEELDLIISSEDPSATGSFPEGLTLGYSASYQQNAGVFSGKGHTRS